MKYFNVYKKRDGQTWQKFNEIYATDFKEAQQIFAKQMTDDNWEKSNDINWLDPSEEHYSITEAGWYNLNSIDKHGNPELFCSEKAIKEGFSYWNEDVYSWEIRDNFEIEVFENEDGEVILYTIDTVESLEAAEELYPKNEGYIIKRK